MKRAAAMLAAALPALAAAGVRPAYGGTIRIGVPVPAVAAAPGTAERSFDLLVERARSAPLLEVAGSGELAPGALAEVPAAEAGGRAFRLRLRPGLRAADGRPLGAEDVAAHLTSLLRRPAPHAWIALPILGADAVLEGRAQVLAGLQVLSPHELLVTLAFPLAEFPHLLATPPAALPGAGPFVVVPGRAPRAPLLLAPNERHHAGRPFAGAVELRAVDARAASRLLASGELDLVLGPEAAGGRAGPPLPALDATVAALNAARLGAGAEPLRHALAALDRGELARRFVRGPARGLAALWPLDAAPGDAPGAPPPPPGPLPQRVAILADATSPNQRALAERVQVKLFDLGARATVELVPAERFRARLAAGDYDVALVPVPVLAPRPALAAAQITYAVRGAAAARRALESLADLPPEEALALADRLARELWIVPLVSAGLRASLGPALQGLAPGADGGVDLGALWLLGGAARAPPAGRSAP